MITSSKQVIQQQCCEPLTEFNRFIANFDSTLGVTGTQEPYLTEADHALFLNLLETHNLHHLLLITAVFNCSSNKQILQTRFFRFLKLRTQA